jgi:plasmid maintenance system antidote protein VapI
MSNRKFIVHLNKELDSMGMPEPIAERINALAKMLKISKFKADSMLNGDIDSKDPAILALANELGVSVEWLVG